MKIKQYIGAFGLLIISSVACTSHFDELDYPKTTAAVIDPGPIFTRSLVTGSGLSIGIWQNTNQLTTLDWVQYVTTIKANFTQSHYEPVPQSSIWEFWYSQSSFAGLNLCDHAIELSIQIENPIKENIARIWKAYMFQYMTDMYGDIPYSDAFKSITPLYDTQESIYRNLISELQTAVSFLKANKNAGYVGYGDADVVYKGSVEKWIKFGNSMLLRLAMQCSNVAENEITKPVLASIDFSNVAEYISSNDDNAFIIPDAQGPTYHVKNPYSYVAGWDEMRIATPLFERLNRNNDPRKTIIMAPNASGDYVGLAPGQTISDLSSNYEGLKADYCDIGSFFTQDATPFMLISAAEVSFLLAEAAQKGYIAGNAAEYYKKGIEFSMTYYSVSSSDATTFIAAVPYSEENLYEQAWIALFPNGPQSWNLVRRTGKPSIMPLRYSWPNNPDMPRRYSYSSDEVRYNQKNTQEAINRMGGDSHYTRIWWDKK